MSMQVPNPFHAPRDGATSVTLDYRAVASLGPCRSKVADLVSLQKRNRKAGGLVTPFRAITRDDPTVPADKCGPL